MAKRAKGFTNYTANLVRGMRRRWRAFRAQLRRDPVQIMPYDGYGTPEIFYIRGRVLEDKGVRSVGENDSLWTNLSTTYRRLESDEVPHARLRIEFRDESVEVITNGEGYFQTECQLTPPLRQQESGQQAVWHQVHCSLLSGVPERLLPIEAIGQVLVPPPTAGYGVISDIDDTILQTHATDLFKMIRLTFLQNAYTRLPFTGVATFYQALQQGPQQFADNPIFYVSSSPWNLYDLLTDFMQLNDIPRGPLFLRDFGLNRQLLGTSGHHGHKLTQIQRLLTTYPHLPFILIGDSGQEDPEIYREVVDQFPERILAIYIRDVSLEGRDTEVDAIIQAVGANGVEMVRAADTVAAATHALQQGLIGAESLAKIRKASQKDRVPAEGWGL